LALVLCALGASSCGNSGGSGGTATGAGGSMMAGSSSAGGSKPVDPIVGKACEGPQDCDDETYCHSDDRDCGPGNCRERPSSPRGFATEIFCGCDGNLYETVNAAPFQGIDLGKNTRCETTAGINWRCGERILCGYKPCPKQLAVCNPMYACMGNGNSPQDDFFCMHSQEYGYYCDIVTFNTRTCDDPAILDACNGCYDSVPCGSDNTHEFSSFTCTEDACQLRTVECIK
jgi:hypothetical protein